MNRVLLARLIDLVIVLFGVSIIVFLMIRMIPGDAVAIMLGANTEITPERMAELNRRVGLDRPIVEQYLLWAGSALRGDFGTSLGLRPQFMTDAIRAVGNYSELYDRHFGPQTGAAMLRGQNALYSNGGLLYAPPIM